MSNILNEGEIMYSETLFHGSNRSRGETILQKQQMFVTTGSKHWLGDGSYFFTEDLYSYKWIVDMFKKRHQIELNYEVLYSHYIIVKTLISIPKVRVFDLTKAEHKIMFDKVNKLMIDKKRVRESEYAEGVVLNYMFNELDFGRDYDLVKSIFIINKNRYTNVRSRIGYMPQEQICIKNLNVVDSISEYDFSEREKIFNVLLEDYYFEVNIS